MILPLLTTTNRTNGNPGDAFIQLGLSHLINSVHNNVEYLLVSKDNKEDYADKRDFIKRAGQIIYAGTPQYNNYDDWIFWYDWGIWKDYFIPDNLKFHTVAGGSGFPNPTMTPKDFTKHCLSSEKTRSILNSRKIRTSLCTVRDAHCHELLNTIGQKNTMLPCTATWAGNYYNLYNSTKEYTLLVPPDPKSVLHTLKGVNSLEEMSKKILGEWKSLYNSYKDENPLIVCNGKTEYRLFLDNGMNCFYSNDLYATLAMYSKARAMISSRLHACLPAFGMKVPRIVSIPIDTRGKAVELCNIPQVPINEWNIERIRQAAANEVECDLSPAQNAYKELFKEYL